MWIGALLRQFLAFLGAFLKTEIYFKSLDGHEIKSGSLYLNYNGSIKISQLFYFLKIWFCVYKLQENSLYMATVCQKSHTSQIADSIIFCIHLPFHTSITFVSLSHTCVDLNLISLCVSSVLGQLVSSSSSPRLSFVFSVSHPSGFFSPVFLDLMCFLDSWKFVFNTTRHTGNKTYKVKQEQDNNNH